MKHSQALIEIAKSRIAPHVTHIYFQEDEDFRIESKFESCIVSTRFTEERLTNTIEEQNVRELTVQALTLYDRLYHLLNNES